MSIGENIKKIRKESGLTQAEFSKKIGISRTYLSDLENNRKSPSVETLDKIAEKLDVSTDFLISGKIKIEYFKKSLDEFLVENRIAEKDDVFKLNLDTFIKFLEEYTYYFHTEAKTEDELKTAKRDDKILEDVFIIIANVLLLKKIDKNNIKLYNDLLDIATASCLRLAKELEAQKK